MSRIKFKTVNFASTQRSTGHCLRPRLIHPVEGLLHGLFPISVAFFFNLRCSGVALVHALGHALRGVCRIPHGVAMNIFSPYGLEFNIPVCGDIISELLMPLAGADIYAKTPDEKKASEVVAILHSVKDALSELSGLPRALEEAWVKKENFEEVAQKALHDPAMSYNSLKVDHKRPCPIEQGLWINRGLMGFDRCK